MRPVDPRHRLRLLTSPPPLWLAAAILLVALHPVPVAAAPHELTPSSLADREPETAPVVVDGRTLFLVTGGPSYPAEERARQIARRIEMAAADTSVQPEALRLEPHDDYVAVLAGTHRLMAITDGDVQAARTSRDVVDTYFVTRIATAIQGYRADRQPARLVRRAAETAGLAAGLVIVLWAASRVLHRLRASLERRLSAHAEHVEAQSFNLISARHVWRVLAACVRAVWVLTAAVLVYVFLEVSLTAFPWTRGLGVSLAAVALDPLRTFGTGVVGLVPDVIFLVFVVVVTRYTLRLVHAVFDGLGDGRIAVQGFDAEWAAPTYRLVRLGMIALALVVAYPYIPGSGSAAFKGLSVFFGVVFSLGSSSVIGNTLAGFSMTYRRAFRLGDRIKVGTYVGNVERIRMTVTHLRTTKNEEVIVPNSMILSSEVLNYSAKARTEGLVLHTTVGIGYETPWRQVEAMLREAARRVPGLATTPPPFVHQLGLGDFCVTYELNAYCHDADAMPALYTALHQNILDVFNEYGVQIMTPAYEGDTPQPKVVPRSEWYAAPAEPPATVSAEGAAGA